MEPQKTQRALDLAAKKRIIGEAYSASSPRFGLRPKQKLGLSQSSMTSLYDI